MFMYVPLCRTCFYLAPFTPLLYHLISFISLANSVFIIHHSNTITKLIYFQDAKRGTELDYVLARKNPLFKKPVYLELWGSPLFAIRQKIVSPETTEGTIFLLGPLDFEKQSMYHLSVLALVSRMDFFI